MAQEDPTPKKKKIKRHPLEGTANYLQAKYRQEYKNDSTQRAERKVFDAKKKVDNAKQAESAQRVKNAQKAVDDAQKKNRFRSSFK